MRTGRRQSHEGEDRQLEREVLALALVEHPLRLTLGEARRDLGRPVELERAVAALVGAGLLSVEGEEIFPTPAAVRFNEVEPIKPPSTA